MRGLTEDELDILLIVVLALIAVGAMGGWFPLLGQIFPSLMGGMFRVMDMLKDQIPSLVYFS